MRWIVAVLFCSITVYIINAQSPEPEKKPIEKKEQKVDERSVHNFGEEPLFPPVQGFDVPLATTSNKSDDKKIEPSKKAKDSPSTKFREYARSIIRQYDKNKDGVLQKDEHREMRGPAAGADVNGDGNITQDEIVGHLGDQSKSKPSNTKNASKGDKDNRDMIRFRTPHERLPDGLPDWFRDRDYNFDGQVSMCEFTPIWSDSKIVEFDKYDTNSDGLITSKECLSCPPQLSE